MALKGLASQKINGKVMVIVLLLLAIPGLIWFRFLYSLYFVDTMSPEMAKMRDMMMHPLPAPLHAVHKKQVAKPSSVQKPSAGPGQKGEKGEKGEPPS